MDRPVLQPLRHNGKRYGAGDTAPEGGFTRAQLARLIAVGVLGNEAPDLSGGGAGDNGAGQQEPHPLVEAIASLDWDDKSLWTEGGKPQVAALANASGMEVNAEARDAAWGRYMASVNDEQ